MDGKRDVGVVVVVVAVDATIEMTQYKFGFSGRESIFLPERDCFGQ